MATNAKEFYEAIRHLPPKERIRLAALILDDLSSDSSQFSDFWTEQDIKDLTAFSLSYNFHEQNGEAA